MPSKRKEKDSTPSSGKKDDGGEVSGKHVGLMMGADGLMSASMVDGASDECNNG